MLPYLPHLMPAVPNWSQVPCAHIPTLGAAEQDLNFAAIACLDRHSAGPTHALSSPGGGWEPTLPAHLLDRLAAPRHCAFPPSYTAGRNERERDGALIFKGV